MILQLFLKLIIKMKFMKSLYLFIYLILISSCSTKVHRFGEKKYFNQRYIRNIEGDFFTKKSTYYESVKDSESCFESNPKNKETITIDANYVEFALNHFYKRLVKLDVILRKVDSQVVQTEVIATDNVSFNLEVAHCYIEEQTFVSWDNPWHRYVSFRLAD